MPTHDVLLISRTGGGGSLRRAVESLRVADESRLVTVLVTAARPLTIDIPSGVDAVRFLRGTSIGELAHGTVVAGFGHEVAVWAALPNMLGELLDDLPMLVMNDRCWVTGSLNEFVLAPSSDGIAGLARHVTGRVASGGWIPEVMMSGVNALATLAVWSAHARAQIRAGSALGDPWSNYPVAGGAVTTVIDGRFRRSPHAAAGPSTDLANTIAHSQVRLVDLGTATPEAPWAFFHRGSTADSTSVRQELPNTGSSNLAEVRKSIAAGLAALVDPDVSSPTDLLGFGLDAPLRAAAIRIGIAGSDLPPDPYMVGGTAQLVAWLSTGGSATGTQRSRWLDELWRARPDLRSVFPSPRWRDRAQLDRWQWVSGLAEGNTPLVVLPDLPGRPTLGSSARIDGGVTIVGFLDAQLGLGEAGRRLRDGLAATDVPTNALRYDRHASRRALGVTVADGTTTDRPDRRVIVMSVAPPSVPQLLDDLADELHPDQRLVGAFYWETDRLTEDALIGVRSVDRIWAATTFLVDVFSPIAVGPVELVPIPLEFPTITDRAGARLRSRFDDRFTFLFSFDMLSVPRRKNPEGLIDAYRRAFPQENGATRLVIKTMNGDTNPEMVQRWWHLCGGRNDIEIRDENLSARARLELVAAADCYVSLHRSEGLGLTMAEAMSQRVPVIATGYGGNLDFMDESCALLVPYSTIDVGAGCPYPPDGRWADPDLDIAADMMTRVASDPSARSRLVAAAEASLARFAVPNVAPLIRRAAIRALEQ